MSRYSTVASFSQDYSETSADVDRKYLTLSLINNGSQSGPFNTTPPVTPASYNIPADGPNPQAILSYTTSAPVIQDTSKYCMSIVRASINGATKTLPVLLPSIRIGVNNPANDVNLLVYDVGLSVSVNYSVPPLLNQTNTFSATQALIHVPEVTDPNFAPIPASATTQTGQDISTLYYYYYSVSHFVDILNTALQGAWNQLNVQFNAWYLATFGVAGPNLTTQPPRVTWNPSNQLFYIYSDRYGFGDNQIAIVPPAVPQRSSAGSNADENFSLYFDANTFGLLSNFNALLENLPQSFTYKILITNPGNIYNNLINVSSPPAPIAKSYWVTIQDAPSSSSLWCPCDEICFVSQGGLSVVPEEQSQPIRFGDSSVNVPITAENDYSNIITTIQIEQVSAFSYREYLSYVPTAEYRRISFLRGKSSLNQFSISVYWRNRLNNQLVPLLCYNLSNINLKMLFERRGLATYPHPSLSQFDKF